MPADAEGLLVDFLAGRDVACPACGYNLRDLTSAVCPECGERLGLHVAGEPVRFGLFIAAVSPGIFSGICAVLMVIPVVMSGSLPIGIALIESFGVLSGVAACVLIAKRHRFIRQAHEAQVAWALGMWAVHVTVFMMMVVGAAVL